MLTDDNYDDLRTKGYTVVPEVLTHEECDNTIGQYRGWLSQFKDGEWPYSVHSLIQRYNSGNMAPTWFVRLKSKKVFAQIWQTDKLLSSIDAIAIGRPPEEGEEPFDSPESHWLHVDQGSSRLGLHAYQGAVYLDEAAEDDWTLHVMEGSHLHLGEFYSKNTKAALRSDDANYYRFRKEELVQMEEKGCTVKRVPVPKGGMVLWDSRLTHANASPIEGRKNPGRWRFCVFVSMTPAIWASQEDMRKKKEAYDNASMTTHWSSQGIMYFNTSIPSFAPREVDYPKELPDIAKTRDAKLISGAIPYNFKDGYPNGDEYFPKWRGGYPKNNFVLDKKKLFYGISSVTVVLIAVGYAVFRFRQR